MKYFIQTDLLLNHAFAYLQVRDLMPLLWSHLIWKYKPLHNAMFLNVALKGSEGSPCLTLCDPEAQSLMREAKNCQKTEHYGVEGKVAISCLLCLRL